MSAAYLSVRPMRDEDLPAVIALLTEALGPAASGADRAQLFAWKHLQGPFGRSIVMVAERDEQVVGLRAFMRWRFDDGEGRPGLSAVRAVDTATAASARRTGVFSRLTTDAVEKARGEGVAFIFNTPNDSSRPGYLKMGWSDVTTWPMWIGLRRPSKVLRAALRRDIASGVALPIPERTPLRPAADVLGRDDAVSLVAGAARAGPGFLWTPRTPEYLRWRYADGPIAYHALVGGSETSPAMVLGRVRARGPLREAVITEVLFRPDAERVAAQLLWAFPGAAGADHGVVSFSRAHPGRELLKQAGMHQIPRVGMRFTGRRLNQAREGSPDPLQASSWAVSLGDLELF